MEVILFKTPLVGSMNTVAQYECIDNNTSLFYKATHGGHQKIEKGKKEKKNRR